MQTKALLLAAIAAFLLALYPRPASAQRVAHVVDVTAEVTPTEYDGACPKTFKFAGVITVDRGGRVKYQWQHSDGKHRLPQTTYFSGPDAHKVIDVWTLGNSSTAFHYAGYARLRIISPSSALSGKASFTLNCVPRSGAKKSTEARPNK
jgi:hypothetical protein